MDEADYIKNRLDDQCSYYESNSGKYKKRYQSMKVAEMVMAAAIPFLTGFFKMQKEGDFPVMQFIVGLMGIAIALIGGSLVLFKYHEQWILYRKAAEDLNREKFYYQTKSGPYKSTDDAFRILVERVETILSNENQNWGEMNTKKDGADGAAK